MGLKHYLFRSGYSLARRIWPVIHYRNFSFVFRHEDVVEVLKRDQDFLIAPVNGKNIERHVGKFMLGMDASAQLDLEQKAMYSIVRREDEGRIRSFVRKEAKDVLTKLKANGQPFNLIQEFTRTVPLRMVSDYFGIPGRTEQEMMTWNRLLFWDIFVNFKDDPELRAKALKASTELRIHMEEIIKTRIEQRDRGEVMPDDLVTRLVNAQLGNGPSLDADGIRRNLAGSMLGAEEPISRVCVHALMVLLERPKSLSLAINAAQSDEIETVGRITFDALRFKPSNPVIIRKTEKEQWLGATNKKQRKIKAGQTVYAVTQSAMLDPTVFPDPHEIKQNRPYDHYLHFGYGLHVCYGSYINYVAIPEMMAAILRELKNAKAISKPTYDGTFPDQWIWTFNT